MEAYSNIDSDTREMLEVMANVRIKAEKSPSMLSRWHKSAARASSIAEFEAKM